MQDLEAGREMLAAAQNDLQALRHMLDPNAFPGEIFGFHAQQAIEKTLKARLSLSGKEYPATHSIRLLIVLLEESGVDVKDLGEFADLTVFAVRFRYARGDGAAVTFDRRHLLARVEETVGFVARLFRETEEPK